MNIMNYAVITDNGGGENEIWHDVEGEEYTFPPKYCILYAFLIFNFEFI